MDQLMCCAAGSMMNQRIVEVQLMLREIIAAVIRRHSRQLLTLILAADNLMQELCVMSIQRIHLRMMMMMMLRRRMKIRASVVDLAQVSGALIRQCGAALQQ
jgi:hypothetical protein